MNDPQIFPAGQPINLNKGGQNGTRPIIVTGGASTAPTGTASEAALRRYLLTRALGRSVINTVQCSGIAVLAVAALCWLGGVKILAVLVGLVALAMFGVRALLSTIERRLTGSARLGAIEPRVDKLVARTSRGLGKELRRVGLPGSPWAPILIALRLIRPFRRARTLAALSRIELAAVVPASQLDELHLLLQTTR